MDQPVVTALIAGTISLIGIVVSVVTSNVLGKKRDHEADWRKMKLEHYREFIAAHSAAVHSAADIPAKRRYADAVNSLTLVAPPQVLAALYSHQSETSERNSERSLNQVEKTLSNLLRLMRRDCQPKPPLDDSDFIFKTFDIPRLGMKNEQVS